MSGREVQVVLDAHNLLEGSGGATECTCGWPNQPGDDTSEHEVLHIWRALEPVRAAERQEARADALEDAARRVRAVKNMPPGYTVDPARLLDELAENCRDRADGVTGRSET